MPSKATLTDCVQVIEEGETGPRPRAQVSSNLTRSQTIMSSWPSNDKWRLEGASWQITVVLDSSEVATLAIILSVLRVVKSALFGRAFQSAKTSLMVKDKEDSRLGCSRKGMMKNQSYALFCLLLTAHIGSRVDHGPRREPD